MDYAFFEELTDEEAENFLDDYRIAGVKGIEVLSRLVADRGGIALDFSVGSIRQAFEVVASQVRTEPAAVDQSLPQWIQESESYRAGLYDLSDESRPLVVWLSFYFAETLVRAFGDTLRWGVGDRDTALRGQPVLEGFKRGVQMSPLLVTENLVRRLIQEADPSMGKDVDRAVALWQDLIVEPPSSNQ